MTFPQSFRRAIARIVLEEIPAISIRGHHTFRVDVVRVDGRVDLVSTTDAFEPISNVDHWCGVAGAAALPVVGSTVTVVFLDDDVKQPALVSYQPLRATGGKPTQSSIDATTLKLGPTAASVQLAGSGPAVARVGDPVNAGALAVAMVAGVPSFTYTPPGGVAQVGAAVTLSGVISGGSSKVTSG